MMQGFGDAGKVGAVRRGCHATDAGPTTTRSVRASIHGTSTAEHRDALRRINRLSSRGLCIRKYPINFHQVTSAAALSCPAAVTSHQSPVPNQYRIQRGPDKARAPHISFPCSWALLRPSPTTLLSGLVHESWWRHTTDSTTQIPISAPCLRWSRRRCHRIVSGNARQRVSRLPARPGRPSRGVRLRRTCLIDGDHPPLFFGHWAVSERSRRKTRVARARRFPRLSRRAERRREMFHFWIAAIQPQTRPPVLTRGHRHARQFRCCCTF
ncbi:uncharacterized protein K444DRAFT_419327 [Hyaloscypha bicolor E]|uniref:Uncharacterized protein n=1 Tax=Hyaloscypha bicolor E TaxID=1095630 RepID=A0A2J6T7E1_9HELO|nr:uncharacterized protein K444DRAFT_419327 [Hyaloscypha bicolor E]PMD58940.1 hypothetical protein K444DRAFT_419327 [Hyaloscypha bicolor E]